MNDQNMYERPHSPADRFALVRDVTPTAAILHAFGDFDFFIAATLERELTECAGERFQVIADLSECRYIDASIVTVLVRMHHRLGERFCVVAPAYSPAYRLLLIVDLVDWLSIHPTVAAVVGEPALSRRREPGPRPTLPTAFLRRGSRAGRAFRYVRHS